MAFISHHKDIRAGLEYIAGCPGCLLRDGFKPLKPREALDHTLKHSDHFTQDHFYTLS